MRSLPAFPFVALGVMLAACPSLLCGQRAAGPAGLSGQPPGTGMRGGSAPQAGRGLPGGSRNPGYGPGPGSTASAGSIAAGTPSTRTGRAFQQSLFPPPGVTSTRSVYYVNGLKHYGEPDRRERSVGGAVGFFVPGFPGSLDPDDLSAGYGPDLLNPQLPLAQNSYDPSSQNLSSRMSPEAEGLYLETQGRSRAGAAEDGMEESADSDQPPPYVTAPRRAYPPRTPDTARPLPQEDAVTLIFKDGRPPEQIRNYAVTRTALYIATDRVRTVPLEEIDVPATVKINEKAGVDFQVPPPR